jgi:hypothetical protein
LETFNSIVQQIANVISSFFTVVAGAAAPPMPVVTNDVSSFLNATGAPFPLTNGTSRIRRQLNPGPVSKITDTLPIKAPVNSLASLYKPLLELAATLLNNLPGASSVTPKVSLNDILGKRDLSGIEPTQALGILKQLIAIALHLNEQLPSTSAVTDALPPLDLGSLGKRDLEGVDPATTLKVVKQILSLLTRLLGSVPVVADAAKAEPLDTVLSGADWGGLGKRAVPVDPSAALAIFKQILGLASKLANSIPVVGDVVSNVPLESVTSSIPLDTVKSTIPVGTLLGGIGKRDLPVSGLPVGVLTDLVEKLLGIALGLAKTLPVAGDVVSQVPLDTVTSPVEELGKRDLPPGLPTSVITDLVLKLLGIALDLTKSLPFAKDVTSKLPLDTVTNLAGGLGKRNTLTQEERTLLAVATAKAAELKQLIAELKAQRTHLQKRQLDTGDLTGLLAALFSLIDTVLGIAKDAPVVGDVASKLPVDQSTLTDTLPLDGNLFDPSALIDTRPVDGLLIDSPFLIESLPAETAILSGTVGDLKSRGGPVRARQFLPGYGGLGAFGGLGGLGALGNIAKPVTDITKPALQVTSPVVGLTKPGLGPAAPVLNVAAPVNEVAAPILDTVKPVSDAAKSLLPLDIIQTVIQLITSLLGLGDVDLPVVKRAESVSTIPPLNDLETSPNPGLNLDDAIPNNAAHVVKPIAPPPTDVAEAASSAMLQNALNEEVASSTKDEAIKSLNRLVDLITSYRSVRAQTSAVEIPSDTTGGTGNKLQQLIDKSLASLACELGHSEDCYPFATTFETLLSSLTPTTQAPFHKRHDSPQITPAMIRSFIKKWHTVGASLSSMDPEIVQSLMEIFLDPSIAPSDGTWLGKYPEAVRQFVIELFYLGQILQDSAVPTQDKIDILQLMFDGSDLMMGRKHKVKRDIPTWDDKKIKAFFKSVWKYDSALASLGPEQLDLAAPFDTNDNRFDIHFDPHAHGRENKIKQALALSYPFEELVQSLSPDDRRQLLQALDAGFAYPPPKAKRTMRHGLRRRQYLAEDGLPDEGVELDDAEKLSPGALGPTGSLDPLGMSHLEEWYPSYPSYGAQGSNAGASSSSAPESVSSAGTPNKCAGWEPVSGDYTGDADAEGYVGNGIDAHADEYASAGNY